MPHPKMALTQYLLYWLFLHSFLCIFIHTTFLIHCKHWDTEILQKNVHAAQKGTMDLWPKVVKLNFKCTIITMVIAEIISLSLIQMNCFYYMSIYSHYTPLCLFKWLHAYSDPCCHPSRHESRWILPSYFLKPYSLHMTNPPW